MFKCNKCQKSFTRHDNKLRHEVSCGGLKRHSCHICNIQFSRSDAKKRHIEQVHSPNIHSSTPEDDSHQVIIYVCHQCKKQFQRHSKSGHKDARKMADKSTQTSEIPPDEIYEHPLSIHVGVPALNREEFPITFEEHKTRFLKKFNLFDVVQPRVLDCKRFGQFGFINLAQQ